MTSSAVKDALDPRDGRHWLFWLIVGAIFVYALYALQAVLLPFGLGAAVAYFLNPVADLLERLGLSRTLATIVITACFALVMIAALVILVPLLADQINSFIAHVPGYASSARDHIGPLMRYIQQHVPPEQVNALKAEAGAIIGKAGSWSLEVVSSLLSSSLQLIDLLSLVILTPVVSFYLLRDWGKIIHHIDGWLPKAHARDIREQAHKIDTTLAGFARGQALVCFILATLYGGGLTLVGLDLGLVVGIGAGLLTFVPFVGTFGGLVVSVGLAFAQFGDLTQVGLTAGVFLIGHLLESNFLSPTLVGNRVGLHPVWIIFAVLAGASLLGFLGILLAVPVAAALGVVARYFLDRYLHSSIYDDHLTPETTASGDAATHDLA